MHTILGSNGSVGQLLANELRLKNLKVRLVGRNPRRTSMTDEIVRTDLLIYDEMLKATAGSEVVYVTIGFPYKTKAWRQMWPVFMKNLLNAARVQKFKVVFLDNMYMYDKKYMHDMTEETPINPCSQKGQVRAEVVQMLLNAIEAGDVEALIARSADFYGTGIPNSILLINIYDRLKAGKSANCICSANKIHNFTYVNDSAKAMALLGNTPDAFNQTWHLPTTRRKMTQKQWIELFAGKMGVEPRYSEISMGLLSFLSLFVPILKEIKDVAYQSEADYFFNSSRFENRFGIMATDPDVAVETIVSGS